LTCDVGALAQSLTFERRCATARIIGCVGACNTMSASGVLTNAAHLNAFGALASIGFK